MISDQKRFEIKQEMENMINGLKSIPDKSKIARFVVNHILGHCCPVSSFKGVFFFIVIFFLIFIILNAYLSLGFFAAIL